MTTQHYSWPEIEAFHNIRKYACAHPEILNGCAQVMYRAKVKLHGTNAAVQVHPDGRVVAQSRSQVLENGLDNAGFAAWVAERAEQWQKTFPMGMIVYGEWCGPGIQKGVAVSQIPQRTFAVFGARPLKETDIRFIDSPKTLSIHLSHVPDVKVLPWFGDEVAIDWLQSAENLQMIADRISESVAEVEKEDPWVKETFGVSGTGEGLVFYPVSNEHVTYESFKNLVFKAKGDKHKVVKTAAPAQVDPAVASSVDAFADMVLTKARLEQGVMATSSDGTLTYEMKSVGKFIGWVCKDVEKETQDELEASGLTWKQVQGRLSERARQFYLLQAKKL